MLTGVIRLAVAFLLLGSLSPAQAQDGDSASKSTFGTAVEAYEFQPGFLLTVSRDAGGAPVELIVHKATIAGRGHPDNTFSWNRLDAFVDTLVPPSIRGDKLGPGVATFCSGLCHESREYAKAVVTVVYNEYDPTREIVRLEVRFRVVGDKPSLSARPN